MSDYLQNFLIDFVNVSNFSNSFFDDLHADNLNKSNILDIEQIFQSIKSIDNSTKKKKFFYYKSKKYRHYYCNFLKKLVSFLAMVRLRYTPNEDDLSLSTFRLLRRIWNMSTHSDKREHVDLIIYEEWAAEYLKKKWEDDFLDFETSIKKFKKMMRHLLILMRFLFLAKKLYMIF